MAVLKLGRGPAFEALTESKCHSECKAPFITNHVPSHVIYNVSIRSSCFPSPCCRLRSPCGRADMVGSIEGEGQA